MAISDQMFSHDAQINVSHPFSTGDDDDDDHSSDDNNNNDNNNYVTHRQTNGPLISICDLMCPLVGRSVGRLVRPSVTLSSNSVKMDFYGF